MFFVVRRIAVEGADLKLWEYSYLRIPSGRFLNDSLLTIKVIQNKRLADFFIKYESTDLNAISNGIQEI